MVVTEYNWPAPPVANRTLRAANVPTEPSACRTRTPQHRPPSTTRSTANTCSCTAAAVARTVSTSTRSISAPVAAPPACTTRDAEWPPSRPNDKAPSASRSKRAPHAMSSPTRAGPSATMVRTASTSHNPAPTDNVSATCNSVESDTSSTTAATPPWAQRVAASDRLPLVTTPTSRPCSRAARTAADSPAMPLPSTNRSTTGSVTAAHSQQWLPPGSRADQPRPSSSASRPAM